MPCRFFVASTGGSDAATGLSPASAFATLQHAMLIARAVRGNSSLCVIELMDGTEPHTLAQPLIVEPADSFTVFKAARWHAVLDCLPRESHQ